MKHIIKKSHNNIANIQHITLKNMNHVGNCLSKRRWLQLLRLLLWAFMYECIKKSFATSTSLNHSFDDIKQKYSLEILAYNLSAIYSTFTLFACIYVTAKCAFAFYSSQTHTLPREQCSQSDICNQINIKLQIFENVDFFLGYVNILYECDVKCWRSFFMNIFDKAYRKLFCKKNLKRSIIA